MTATPALRVCTVYVDELAHQCRAASCRIEQCSRCLRCVHYHPGESIQGLGPEEIVCTACVPIDMFIDRHDGSWIEQPPGGPFQGAQDPSFRLPPETQN